MGWRESLLAAILIEWIGHFVRAQNLGLVTGPDGFIQIMESITRGPDVAFISWHRLPGGRIPTDPVPRLSPDLVVEILSDSNTRGEMARKRREYFQAGVRQVWMVDPRDRTVAAYGSPSEFRIVADEEVLDGGEVLPGLRIPVAELFAELDRTAPEASDHPRDED